MLSAQTGTDNKEEKMYPAMQNTDSDKVDAMLEQFEETNVGNLHIYTLPDAEAPLDYYFDGSEIPRGLYGMFDQNWRNKMPTEFEAYAVYEIKGAGEPYFIIRTKSEETPQAIELFRLDGQNLTFIETLAMGWCENNTCMQQDGWLVDLDGDTQFDLIKKMKVYKKQQPDQSVGNYYAVYKQLENGDFKATGAIPVDIDMYLMEE